MSQRLRLNFWVIAALLAIAQPVTAMPDTKANAAIERRIEHRTLQSQAMNSQMRFDIYVPEAYQQKSGQRFPVVYWLHGGDGFPPGVVAVLAKRFDDAIRAGKIPAMLVVFPHDGHGRNMWANSKDGSILMESFFVRELVPHIDATYRTVGAARGRILEGGSMGGYGAARLGFKYPEMFGAVSMINAGPLQEVLDPQHAPTAGAVRAQATLDRMYGGDPEYFRSQSPWVLAEQNAAAIRSKVVVRQFIGDQDPLLDNNRRFSEHLTALNIPHAFEVLQGVSHGSPRATFAALGDSYWQFFRQFVERDAEATAIIELNRAILESVIVQRQTTLFEEVALDQFVVVAPGGKIEGKSESAAGVTSFDVEGISVTDEQVTFADETAVLVGKLVIDGVMRPVGRLGPMKFMAVFVHQEGDWRLLGRSLTICHEVAVAHGLC